MPDFLESQQEQIIQCYKQMDDIFHAYAVANGLSDSTFWILYTLCQSEKPYTQNDFCEEWYYSKQTVHSALKKSEGQGYIALETAPEDRRSKHILLTEKGERCRSTHFEPLFRAEEAAFAQMDLEHRVGLLRGCRAYLNELRPAVGHLLAPAGEADAPEEG